MRTRAAWYREKAADCERASECIDDLAIKNTYLKAAERWHELARQADLFEDWRLGIRPTAGALHETQRREH